MIRFVKARTRDAEELTEVQRRTFDEDSRRFAGRPGGPPGYDSVDWTLWAIKTGIYFKILAGDQIVGGLILFDMHKRHFNLGRIFIDPGWQNQGIGSQAIRFIEKTFRMSRDGPSTRPTGPFATITLRKAWLRQGRRRGPHWLAHTPVPVREELAVTCPNSTAEEPPQRTRLPMSVQTDRVDDLTHPCQITEILNQSVDVQACSPQPCPSCST